MATHHSHAELIGEIVTVSYLADPSVGHGQFRLENRGTAAVNSVVEAAWLEIGVHRRPLSEITVYDLDLEQMVKSESFTVGAGKTMRFLVSFPKILYEPHFGESTAVGLRLSVNGGHLQALSTVVFERRIPKH